MQKSKLLILVIAVFMITGICMTFIGIFQLVEGFQLKTTDESYQREVVMATVSGYRTNKNTSTSYPSDRTSGPTYSRIFSYEYENEPHSYTESSGSSNTQKKYPIGSQIELTIINKNPQNVMIDSFSGHFSRYYFGSIIVFMGLVFLIMSTSLLNSIYKFIPSKKSNKTKDISKRGTAQYAFDLMSQADLTDLQRKEILKEFKTIDKNLPKEMKEHEIERIISRYTQ